MQKISGMQRNRSNLYAITNAFLIACLFIYLIITSMNQKLPPLIGLFFLHQIVLRFENENKFKSYGAMWYIGILYLFIAEQIHGFHLFSIAVTFIIFYLFIFEISIKFIKFRNLLIALYVVIGYAGTFLVSNTISYAKKSGYLVFGSEYLWYIFIEILIGLLIFRGRLV